MKDKLIKHFEDSLVRQGLAKVAPGDELGARRAIKKVQEGNQAPYWSELANRGLIKRPQEEDPS